VNLLIAGYNPQDGPELYWIDYLSAMTKAPYAAHGYAQFFCLGLMDRYYTPNMSVEEAKDLLRKCFHELKTRFIVNLPRYMIKVIDKDGIREIEL
jgi:20S proteasome subunit beta 4